MKAILIHSMICAIVVCLRHVCSTISLKCFKTKIAGLKRETAREE